MKKAIQILVAVMVGLATAPVFAQGTAFTYQGRLNDGAGAANGSYDLRFTLHSLSSGGAPLGSAITNVSTGVTNGLFTVALDFGNQFPGGARWLEIGVRTNGGAGFITLVPRQAITATPYAVQAANAATANSASSVAAANITGTMAIVQLPPSVITNGAAGVNFTGTFNGNGAALTNVTAATLATYGVVAWGNNSAGQSTVPVAAQSGVVAIAAGSEHTVVLKNDGSVLAWGRNDSGQSTVPVAAQGSVAAIAAGNSHTLALKNNGSVLTWGALDQSTVPVAAQSGVVAIAAGHYHCVALKNDGSVLAWGSNSFGETNVPVAAQSGVVAIAGGWGYTVALKTNGSVLAWGKNWFGETTVPVAAQSGVVAIAAGLYHTVVLKTNGSVLEWGFFEHGFSVPGAAQSGVVAIAAGHDHTVALKTNGSVLAWGYISSPPVAAQSGVVAIAAGGSCDVALVAQSAAWAKSANTFQADQRLAGNGAIEFGAGFAGKDMDAGKIAYQLLSDGLDIVGAGTNDTSRKISFFAEGGATFTGPVTAPSFNGSFAGDGSGLTNLALNNVALRSGGNTFSETQIVTNGNVGVGTTTPNRLLEVGGLSGTEGLIRLQSRSTNGAAYRIWDVGVPKDDVNTAGKYYSFVIDDVLLGTEPELLIQYFTGNVGIGTTTPQAKLDVNGTVRATSFEGNGGGLTGLQLPSVPVSLLTPPTGKALVVWGDNSYGQLNTPPTVQSGVIAAAAGTTHAVALKTDGSVIAWGGNTYGQATVPPAAQSGVTAIAAGEHHTLAVTGGSVVAWGANDSGACTVPLAAQSGVTNVAAGWGFSLALKNTGGVVVWGDNQAGQNNVPVAGQSGVVGISAGSWFCMALKTNGSVIAWGGFSNGETNLPSSVQSGVIAISAGWYHGLALKTNGVVVAWGYNGSGQTNVPVAAQSGVVAIAADGNHSVALKNDGTIIEWGDFFGGAPASAQGKASAIGAGPSVTMALIPPASIVPLLGTANTFTGNQVVTNGSFVGSGSGLSNLNASVLSSGSVADARLSSNVALRSGGNTFSGAQSFTGPVSVSSGISSTTASNQFNFNASYSDVTMTLRQRVGDNIMLAVQDAATFNRLLVTPAGISVTGDIGASGTNTAAAFVGNGAGLTGLNAASLVSGTVADTRLSANVSLLGASVDSTEITDGTIANADISAAAAIADTKLATISTAGKVADSALSANVTKLGPSIDSSEITDSTIVNADISASAAIADTKLATISTVGKVADSALSANVAVRSGGNSYTGNQTVTGGSVGIGTANPTAALDVVGGARVRASNPGWAAVTEYNDYTNSTFRGFVGADGIGLTGNANQLYFGTYTAHPVKIFSGNTERLVVDSSGNVGIGNTNPTNKLMVVNARCDGSTWINASDRNLKQDFAAVDAQAVLDKVASLPIQSWSYKAQPDQKHVGPVAQDFRAAFGLGQDDTTIATVDVDGVALAAIQGLNQKLEATQAENAELKLRLEKLENLLKQKLGGDQ